MQTIKYIILNLFLMLLLGACGEESHTNSEEEDHHHEDEHAHEEVVHLTQQQFEALEMKVDTISRRNLSGIVEANGHLEVPPQNEATVTTMLGANVVSIQVIEGDDVRKGQALAYLAHPTLIQVQTQYAEAIHKLQLVEQEYKRQERLYKEEVGSGKKFQQAEADYRSANTMVKSQELQLQLLGFNTDRIREENFYSRLPLASPISGTITKVEVKTGQYVPPDKDLFEIVNIDHIHADLMVFEKDVSKVEKGQRIRFTVETLPGKELFATIYSVGKKFETNPKAVHVHAEIENKAGKLIPGMYIQGQILTESTSILALPEAAIIQEGEQYLAFLAEKSMEKEEWAFTPIPVVPGNPQDGWVGITFLEAMPAGTQFAMNNAYYLIAEMKKEEAGHSH